MKLSQIAMATLLASGIAFGAQAAGNTGTVTFSGEVVDSPCDLAAGQDGADIKVDFGQLSVAGLNGGRVATKNFEIKLKNCVIDKKTAAITFTSTDQIAGKNLLKTNGDATGLGIKLNNITFGTALELNGLANGDQTLTYIAGVQKADEATDVTAGAFTASANFEIAYK
ncbi:fimbrial protein [Pragia fontium]|uniref:Pilin (Type 1 fimbria component protein) n=2 Tax=Pragia fontium TaxID=82985 RepID=A0AAJ5BFV4_9GAMM|nr:fimbrial protein [Pragia fontium]AKJ41287.1 pilus assembly protein FimA [Pragia fontium]SFC06326.1 Pilin (type 1 fimbria component protein) [Pragia fontium DSM 5563 = ATCC 49100]SUB81515.1 Fimbria A protein precursor [Pragia fontium]VEJ53893.1 Fimbria A protein precursor [Pragia fontium]GKX62833.1 fimbrial A protein [Pragia fontium]